MVCSPYSCCVAAYIAHVFAAVFLEHVMLNSATNGEDIVVDGTAIKVIFRAHSTKQCSCAVQTL